MTGKTAWVWAVALAAPMMARAQDAPPATPPAAPSSTAQEQEASDADVAAKPKVKVRDYEKWTFNVGGGANLPAGTTRTFVRGGGGVATGGVTRNANKYVGLRAEFWWENLPLRDSALGLAQASSASSGLYGIALDPIFNIPVTGRYSGYFAIGPGFYHRYGTLNGDTVPPGSPCSPFFEWWTYCPTSLPAGFASTSQNQFGLNLGGGVARRIGNGHKELYIDWRYQHSKHNKVTTDTRPITIGIRW